MVLISVFFSDPAKRVQGSCLYLWLENNESLDHINTCIYIECLVEHIRLETVHEISFAR